MRTIQTLCMLTVTAIMVLVWGDTAVLKFMVYKAAFEASQAARANPTKADKPWIDLDLSVPSGQR